MLAQLSFNHAFFIAFWLGFVLICWYSKMKFDTKVDFERTDSIMPIWVTWESTTQPFVDKQISYSHVIIVSSWSVTRSLKDILTWPQSNLTYLEGKIKLYLISSKLSSFFQPSRLWFQWSDESCVLPWLLNVFLTFTCWFWRLERNLASILIRCFILVLRSPINWRKRRQGLLHWIQYGLQSSYIKALIIHSSHFGRRPNQVFGWLRTTSLGIGTSEEDRLCMCAHQLTPARLKGQNRLVLSLFPTWISDCSISS